MFPQLNGAKLLILLFFMTMSEKQWAQTSTYLLEEMGALFEAFSLGGNSTRVTPEGPQTRPAKLYG